MRWGKCFFGLIGLDGHIQLGPHVPGIPFPRFIAGDLSTDFIAEEWDSRKVGTQLNVPVEADKTEEALTPPQLAAIVGSLLMHEQAEEEKLRRRTASENGAETSRWRDVGRKEALRRM